MTVEVKPFDVSTHNGILTIVSKKTGDHRTVKISTQKGDAGFMPGKRLVALLVGSDNSSDYRAFGLVAEGGDRVILWKKNRTSPFFAWVSKAIVDPARYEDQVEFKFEGRCRRCNRRLTDPLSIDLGIGPVCRGDE